MLDPTSPATYDVAQEPLAASVPASKSEGVAGDRRCPRTSSTWSDASTSIGPSPLASPRSESEDLRASPPPPPKGRWRPALVVDPSTSYEEAQDRKVLLN